MWNSNGAVRRGFIFKNRKVPYGAAFFYFLRILQCNAVRCGFHKRQNHAVRCGSVKPYRTARKHRTVKSPVIFDILTCRILKFDTSHRNFDTMSNIELRYIASNAFCLPPPRIPVHFYADIEPFFPTYVQYRLSKSYRFDIWFIDIVSNSIFEIISIL